MKYVIINNKDSDCHRINLNFINIWIIFKSLYRIKINKINHFYVFNHGKYKYYVTPFMNLFLCFK